MIAFRRGPRRTWTAADYDSYQVLVSTGARRPAARVTRARSTRLLRQAVRAALRTACREAHLARASAAFRRSTAATRRAGTAPTT